MELREIGKSKSCIWSSRSSHPESELLHRQAYATPHPLQGYATNHHPGSSGQGGAWGAAGRSLGLSGLFDTGLHHASPSAPDASVMNLISALESRGPQPPPSASSLLSQFRTPSWQTAMHTPAPPELFISGALPGSGSFPSSSALSAYQHPASFSSRSFPAASLSLQDTPTFSPTSNGLLSPHDPLLHIKAPSQSSLGFDRLLSSQVLLQLPTEAARIQQEPHLPRHRLPGTCSPTSSICCHHSSRTSPPSCTMHQCFPQPSPSLNPSLSPIRLRNGPFPGRTVLSSTTSGPRQLSPSSRPLLPTPSSTTSAVEGGPTSRTEQYRPIIQPPYSSSSSSSSSSSAGKGYGSPVPPVKTPTSALTGQTPPQQQTQSYSPNQPPTSHLAQSYGGFSSPQAQDLSSVAHQVVEHLEEEAAVAQVVGTQAQEAEQEIVWPVRGVEEVVVEGPIIFQTLAPHHQATQHYPSRVALSTSPQGYPDTRGPSSQAQSYHSTSAKTKADTSMLGVGSQRTQEEVDDDDEFLIQHLLQAQASPAPQASHHHPQQAPQQASQQTQPQPQSVPPTTDSGKGLSYDMGSVVHYGRGDPYSQHSLAPQHSSHSQHVSSHSQIPSHTQMELQKKPQERAEIPYPRKTPEVQQQHSQSQAAASLMDSPTDQSRQPPHLLQSVLSHTTRNKLEPHQQHHKMDSHRQHQQHHKMDSHQPHQQHPKMDSHPQHQQHQKMDSHQHQQHHKIDSHSQHQQHHKMDSHAQQQQHSISQQQAVMESTGGRLGSSKHQAQSQSQTTQLQLQLQSQALEVAAAHYNHGPPPHQHEQSQVKQSSVVSSLDMLERSLSQTSSTDVAVAEDRRGGGGSAGRSGGSSERHRQQQQQQEQLPSHHQPQQTHHSQQHSASELHSFLSEPDISLSTPPHMHHLSQHHPQQQQQQQHPSSQHQQTHSHHPHTQPHPQQQPPLPHHIPPPSASAHSQPQPDPQQPLSSQLTPQQSQMDQQRSEQHQFDTVSPVEKADQSQQSNRFVPLTSICFPDSLLQDEDRSFFPGMEDMFCAEDYKSSCAGGAGPGQGEMNESHTGQEGMDSMKAGQSAGGAGGSAGASYDIMAHHGGDQGYEPYCHGLEEPSNNTMTLDLDSLKTHELPSTVNTEQLGLIQSQAPAMGMGANTAGPNNSGAKMSSVPGGTSAGAGSGGLQSPIFCSSRPKKLLKSSSFHLLKERRDPNTLPKKSYAQEYEFEDDEDKADQPADIRLNSRRLPDLLPDLVSSCRKGGGSGSLSPLMGDIDFYHSSGYSSMGSHSLMPQDGPKKRGRKPTRPKREGPPRPRGRPRIRPMPEPYTPRGMMGEMGGTTIKLPIGTLSSSDALLRTDSLSGTDPALSDGSVGSAPSLGLSPGPPCSTESTRSQDKNKQKSQMMGEGVDDDGLEERGDEKDSESKAGFVASFLDFLKTGKRPPGLDISPGMEPDNGETSPCKSGGLRPLSPAPPPPPPPPPFGDGEGNGGLALGNCPSPKRLEDELKRNLETLPSFSSDEEDSVGKNQDLQKSISSAISALYDTPQLTSNIQTPLPPPPPQPQPQPQPTQAPLTPTLQPPTLSPQPTMHTPHTQPQSNEPDILQPEDGDMEENKEEENEEERSTGEDEESNMTEDREPQLETLGAPKLEASLPEIPVAPTTPEPPSIPPSPSTSSSPSHSPLPPLSLPSPLPPPEEQQENSQPPSPIAPTSPSPPSPPAPAPLPQPATPPAPPPAPPPASPPPPPPSTQKESPMPSPESPASPEEPPAPKSPPCTSHRSKKTPPSLERARRMRARVEGRASSEKETSLWCGWRTFELSRYSCLALQTGREPPPIWRVQKALLQKFSPEIKDGQRQFCATSNYLGYFGDAKRRYQRIYVKFLENVNKKDYVRVCSRRPWRRATPALRVAPPVQREQREKTRTAATTATAKEQREKKEAPAVVPKAREREKEREHEKEREREKRVQLQQEKLEKRAAAAERGRAKEEKKVVERKEKEKAERPPKSKPAKVKAEPPPKKRKKWLKEVPSSSDSDSSDEAASENEMPVKGGVNNRAMREMFRSYVEMLVSTALDPDMIQALEDTDDELYLPPMRKIDSILSEQKRRLLRRVSMSSQHQEVLHAYPQIIVDPLDTGVVRVRLSGDAYNRKTLNRVKKTLPKPQDLKLSADSYRIYSLYHSLHHYKYHTFLQCKKETNTIEQAAEDPGQEEVVQQCMANQSWLDTLFSSFIELLTLSTKA
ncbi:hypothetical protein INR49_013609 [Caranx melampygus]|nr:hypothetical protein INR49_013609 [Caranx melampygus]